MTSSYFAEYKIENGGEKGILILYLLTVFLSSLIGDTLILVASTRFGAIKLNKFIVAIMQHIAACDMLLSLTFILPTIFSLVSNRWFFRFESVIYLVVKVSYDTSKSLITFLTVSKLYIIKCPLSSPARLKKVAHVISSSIWLIAFVLHGSLLATRQCTFFFSSCEYFIQCHLQSSVAKDIIIWFNLMFNAVPSFIIVVTTAAILCHLRKAMKVSRRSGGNVRWHGMAAVSITAAVFLIASVPSLIVYIAIKSSASTITLDLAKIKIMRISHFFFMLNIMSNIFIYYFTIPSFRQFVKSKVNFCNKAETNAESSRRTTRKDFISRTIRLETVNFSSSTKLKLKTQDPQVISATF